jgi:hypothetical protein
VWSGATIMVGWAVGQEAGLALPIQDTQNGHHPTDLRSAADDPLADASGHLVDLVREGVSAIRKGQLRRIAGAISVASDLRPASRRPRK